MVTKIFVKQNYSHKTQQSINRYSFDIYFIKLYKFIFYLFGISLYPETGEYFWKKPLSLAYSVMLNASVTIFIGTFWSQIISNFDIFHDFSDFITSSITLIVVPTFCYIFITKSHVYNKLQTEIDNIAQCIVCNKVHIKSIFIHIVNVISLMYWFFYFIFHAFGFGMYDAITIFRSSYVYIISNIAIIKVSLLLVSIERFFFSLNELFESIDIQNQMLNELNCVKIKIDAKLLMFKRFEEIHKRLCDLVDIFNDTFGIILLFNLIGSMYRLFINLVRFTVIFVQDQDLSILLLLSVRIILRCIYLGMFVSTCAQIKEQVRLFLLNTNNA